MSTFSDSFDEMHNDDLTSDTADRLVNGDFDSLEHADIAAVVSDIRGLSARVPTPVPSAALSEFVGVNLMSNQPPVGAPVTEVDLRSTSEAAPAQSRRNSVFAQLATFAGTIGGKVAITGAVAAASVTGAHATGVVDVPGLPDDAAAVETIETELDGNVEFADIKVPEAIARVEEEAATDTEEVDEKPAVEEAPEPAPKKLEEPKVEDIKPSGDAIADIDKKKSDEEHAAEKVKERAELEAKKAAEVAALEAEEALKAELMAKEEAAKKQAEIDAAKKAAAEAEAKKKAESDKDHDKTVEEKLTSLEEQLNKDKEAVRAEARKQIEETEYELNYKREAKEDALKGIDEQYSGYVADIDASIEASTDEKEIAELEAYRLVKLERWEQAKADKASYYDNKISGLESQLETIEVERDNKIQKLINEFLTATENAKK